MKKIVFITGATSGIGMACAYKFAKENHQLILTGRRKDRLKDLKKKRLNVLKYVFNVCHLLSRLKLIQRLFQAAIIWWI